MIKFKMTHPDDFERTEATPILQHIRDTYTKQTLYDYDCYKVVRLHSDKQFSFFKDKYDGNTHIDISYKFRQPTWPNIGKIFCFKHLEPAVIFLVNYDDGERAYGLYGCSSDVLLPISVCMEDGLETRSYVRYFWDNIYKGTGGINLPFNLTAPVKGTFVTDGIKLRRLLWRTKSKK